MTDMNQSIPKVKAPLIKCKVEHLPTIFEDGFLVFQEDMLEGDLKPFFGTEDSDLITGMYSKEQMKIIYINKPRFDEMANLIDEALESWVEKATDFNKKEMFYYLERKLVKQLRIQNLLQESMPLYSKLLGHKIKDKAKEIGTEVINTNHYELDKIESNVSEVYDVDKTYVVNNEEDASQS